MSFLSPTPPPSTQPAVLISPGPTQVLTGDLVLDSSSQGSDSGLLEFHPEFDREVFTVVFKVMKLCV